MNKTDVISVLREASAGGGTQARNRQVRPFWTAFRALSYVVENAKAGTAFDRVCRDSLPGDT